LDADLAIHECFVAVPALVQKMGFTPESALLVGTQIHTAPEAFGKVMSTIKPRMAVAYHFFKDFDTTGDVFERIKKTYDGPLSLAEDFMVWNVTQDAIRVRMAVVEEHTWAPALASPAIPPEMADRAAMSQQLGWELGYSEFIINGKWNVDDVLRPIYEEASQILGREFEYPETE
jgi:ribonuclease Z